MSRRLSGQLLQVFQAVKSGAGGRRDALSENPGHQLTQTELGLVRQSTIGALLLFCFIYGTESAEELQTLTGRSFADFQSLDNGCEAKRDWRGIEQTVNLTD